MAQASSITPPSNESSQQFLFSWGANSYGQLGLGHKDDTLSPAAMSPADSWKQFVQVAGGGGHSVLLTVDGQLLVCGWNKNGQLGLGDPPPATEDILVSRPLSIHQSRVSEVACGWNHTMAVCAVGRVWVWGSNAFGQLGVPLAQKQSTVPLQLPPEAFLGARVTAVAAGLRHSVATIESGEVYSWGDGRKGQLGHGGQKGQLHNSPTVVGALTGHQCTAVAAGAYHSAAITGQGDLFMWGLNQHGQCAVSPVSKSDVSRDLHHHGHSIDPHKVKPTDSTATDGLFAINDSGWVTNVYRPLKVEVNSIRSRVAEIHCGWSHSIAVTVERTVYSWGRSDYGQLGRQVPDGSRKECSVQSLCSWEPAEIAALKGVKQVSCGSEHTIAINVDDQVVTFGWNEHGMCGSGDEVNVATPLIISTPGAWSPRIVGSGAGHCLLVATKS